MTNIFIFDQLEDKSQDDSTPPQRKQPTTPPESTFKKLAPSKNRYTLLEHDEF